MSSRSKSKNKSQRSKILEDDKIDELLEHITLKRPRNAYTQFCIEEVEKFKKKNKNGKIDLKKFSGECAKKWKDLGEKDQKKYNDKYEEEKLTYKKDIETVRHYLFMDYNDIVRRPPTAYRLFLNERLRNGFDRNEDPKEVKQKASEDWRKMSVEEKSEYLEKKKENDTWFEKAKKTRKVTPLTIFVQRAIEAAKSKGKELPKLADLAATWKSLKASDKKNYIEYAEIINKEREHLHNVYELINGIKPKRPAGAFRVFLQEKAKEKALHSLKEGKEMWDKLSEDEKDHYLKKAHTCRLAYKYKKMIYNKKIKKILPKRPATAYGQFLKDRKGIKVPKGEKAVAYWRPIFDKLPKDQKKKYEEKARKDRDRYERKMAEFKNVVFDMPDGVSQAKYERKAEMDKKRFKKQLKDFETLGYYKKNQRVEKTTTKDEDESEEEERKTKKKKRSSSSKKTTKRTRSKSRSKPKSKTQDMKRSKSRKKSAKK